MQPHSLATITISNAKTPAQKAAEGGWATRHAPFKRGDVLPDTQVPACPRVKVADLPEGFLKHAAHRAPRAEPTHRVVLPPPGKP
jgi:hypothetical protein